MRWKFFSGWVALTFLSASSLRDASLIARYRFDGNANDSGPNGLHGTVSGAQLVDDRFGNPNSAYLFDGKNDYIELPGSSLFVPHISPGGVLRISAWVKVLAVNTDGHNQTRQPVASLGNSGQWSYALYVNDTGPRAAADWWQKGGSDHALATAPSPLNLNQWYELTAEYKYKSYLRVYVNGVLVAEDTTFVGDPYGQTSFGPWIGARRDGQYLNAVIDDVRFYNSPIPEPSSWIVFAGIALAIGGYQLRRHTRASQAER
ncbi:MAG TPA: LamG domain-containing protein [Planctomycetaceae bacterium]|nr:LamG domain-containing protein [Planctomycetaceae bacterium]